MNDPSAVHSIAVHRGFADLLEWHYHGAGVSAWVKVHELSSPLMDAVAVHTVADTELLTQCLTECEGHGLLWREDACLLYAARRLNVKPQPYAYSESEHINRLYDAIGTE